MTTTYFNITRKRTPAAEKLTIGWNRYLMSLAKYYVTRATQVGKSECGGDSYRHISRLFLSKHLAQGRFHHQLFRTIWWLTGNLTVAWMLPKNKLVRGVKMPRENRRLQTDHGTGWDRRLCADKTFPPYVSRLLDSPFSWTRLPYLSFECAVELRVLIPELQREEKEKKAVPPRHLATSHILRVRWGVGRGEGGIAHPIQHTSPDNLFLITNLLLPTFA